MIINYVPDEECRIAMLEEGRLEEFYAERVSADLHVGNIYLGRVVNVEPAIQAAFIDFGIGRNGFLHVSDLHPMYFPGSLRETTEKVGQKTPHRRRPPIQECLKRGQTLLVQVIKEGIGTKGPTLSSYLSIPGRYLVMMPNMERLGVSRRVEDLDLRREMRQILDSLDLPDGFGFILRTAGINRTKTDIKRDLAYLQRLWKSIEKKQKRVKAPTELYAESDLLLRTIRDVLSTSVNRIVVDDPGALKRVDEFMRIIAPRSKSTKLLLYDEPTPIFHTFGIEEQIRSMHSRVAPLPSGGSLIIDSAEAMVAIDVNSGKMRQSQDAETTAYRTNIEAVEEIARQLRLRDLGGLIVLDLIDMRAQKHRRDIENRFKEALKRDRAKTEALRISRFGIIELTRQRMRPSLKTAHFVDCPTCSGRGHIRNPESTATDAMHDLARVLQFENVMKVEMVVSPNVASVILSRKRSQLTRLEEQTGKHVDIRVSQSIAIDRVSLYAYDERNADLDLSNLLEAGKAPSAGAVIDRLMKSKKTFEALRTTEEEAARTQEEGAEDDGADEAPETREETDEAPKRKKRRRRSRRGRGGAETTATEKQAASEAEKPAAEAKDEAKTDRAATTPTSEPKAEEMKPPKKKRRRRKSARESKPAAASGEEAKVVAGSSDLTTPDDGTEPTADAPAGDERPRDDASSSKRRSKRGRRGRRRKGAEADTKSSESTSGKKAEVSIETNRDGAAKKEPETENVGATTASEAAKPAKKVSRSRGSRRKKKAGEKKPSVAEAKTRNGSDETSSTPEAEPPVVETEPIDEPAPASSESPEHAAAAGDEKEQAKRRLYRSRRKLGPGSIKKLQVETRP